MRRGYWWPALWLLPIFAAGLYLFWPRPEQVRSASPRLIAVAGYDDLGDCASSSSLDDRHNLVLSHDGAADWTESDAENHRAVRGSWRLSGTKRYDVTIGDAVTTYALVSREGLCMLVKGDVSAADLSASWFSVTHDFDQPDYDVDRW